MNSIEADAVNLYCIYRQPDPISQLALPHEGIDQITSQGGWICLPYKQMHSAGRCPSIFCCVLLTMSQWRKAVSIWPTAAGLFAGALMHTCSSSVCAFVLERGVRDGRLRSRLHRSAAEPHLEISMARVRWLKSWNNYRIVSFKTEWRSLRCQICRTGATWKLSSQAERLSRV